MKVSQKRLFTIIISFALLTVTLFVYSLFIKPEYAEIQKLRGERNSRQELLEGQKRIINSVKELFAQYGDASQVSRSFALILPDGENVSNVLNQIQSIGKSTGVRLVSLNLQYSSTKRQVKEAGALKPVSTLRVTMVAEAPYKNIKSFLSSLETNIRVMDLASFKMIAGELRGQDLFRHNIVVDTYYQ